MTATEVSRPPGRLSNLSHVELLTQDLAASLWFFTELLGLQVTARTSGRAYLRAFGEWAHHSLVLTESPQSGIGHTAFRVRRAGDVRVLREELKAAGVEVETLAAGAEPGHGESIRFALPSGHVVELLHHFARPASADPSHLRNQPTARRGRGIEVPRIDHVNLMAADVRSVRRFAEDRLGISTREIVVRPDGSEAAAWLATGPLSHDFAVSTDPVGTGRLHHVAFAVESVLDYWRFGEMAHEHGIGFEGGPGRHGGTAGSFVYVREPGGGNRVELFAGGYLVLDPDPIEPVVWTTEDDFRGVCVGQPLSAAFYTTGTPAHTEDTEATTNLR